MGMFSRRPRIGDTARIVEGDYAGSAGRILSLERMPDGEDGAVVLIDDSTVPTIPMSAVVIDAPGALGVLGRVERSRHDPADRDIDYEKIRRSGQMGIL